MNHNSRILKFTIAHRTAWLNAIRAQRIFSMWTQTPLQQLGLGSWEYRSILRFYERCILCLDMTDGRRQRKTTKVQLLSFIYCCCCSSWESRVLWHVWRFRFSVTPEPIRIRGRNKSNNSSGDWNFLLELCLELCAVLGYHLLVCIWETGVMKLNL